MAKRQIIQVCQNKKRTHINIAVLCDCGTVFLQCCVESYCASVCISYMYTWASLIAQLVKNWPAVQETSVQFLGQEDPLEKGESTHSSMLAWRISRTVYIIYPFLFSLPPILPCHVILFFKATLCYVFPSLYFKHLLKLLFFLWLPFINII